MKSEIAWLLALAIMLGVTGCEKPDSLADWTTSETAPVPEIAAADIAPPADESAAAETEAAAPEIEAPAPKAADAELSPRDKILALRAEKVGMIRRDLAFDGAPLGETTIVSIDDSGIRLQHTAGVTDLAWGDVPAPLKEAWGYDPIGSALFSTNDSTGSPKLAVVEIESAAPIARDSTEPEPEPIALDPRSQARVLALQSQIAKLSENLRNARETVKEAKVFHGELAVIYAAQEKKAAAEKAARVYERMRASSCSS